MLLIFTLSQFLACPDPTYDVPTTYTLPSENPGQPQEPRPHNGSPQDGMPQEGAPEGGNSPAAGEEHEHVPHREMPPNTPGGNIPEGDELPPPPKEDVENSGDDPPPSDDSIIRTPGEPPEPLEEPLPPIDPSPDAISFEDGCIISHQWKKLRAEDVKKIKLKASLQTPKPIQTLLVDIVSTESKEVQVGLICPTKEIEVEIPKSLGEVQLAIFIDNNGNGPSEDDEQALSELFTVTDKDISLPDISLSDSPISFYNFKE